MTATSDERRQRRSAPDRADDTQRPAPPPAPWPGLGAAAARAGEPLSTEQLARLATYLRLLREWNAKFNLTAITEPAEIERRLFLDALLLAPVIAGVAGPREPLIDIGSGAGFPGVPLAIREPERPVTLVEATGKKTTFLNQVIAELGLHQARTLHARAEDVARRPAERQGYGVATARAVAALPALIELAMPLLRVGGHAVFPKGRDLGDELAAGEQAAALLGAEIVADDVAGESTRILVVRKQRPTPDRYPRRAGIPAREPLGAGPDRPPAGSSKQNGHRRQSQPRVHDDDAVRRRVAR